MVVNWSMNDLKVLVKLVWTSHYLWPSSNLGHFEWVNMEFNVAAGIFYPFATTAILTTLTSINCYLDFVFEKIGIGEYIC
jgi:hypothetical protein